jgi:FixH
MSSLSSAITSTDASEMKRAERRARNFWVSFIVFMLGLQVAGGVTAIILASGDPSNAIVPNYHKAALNWDITHRERTLVDHLGWKVYTDIAQAPLAEHSILTVNIRDAFNAPVTGLRLKVRMYHHARGKEIETKGMGELQDGTYQMETHFVRSGVYQLDIRIEGSHGIAAVSREIEIP